MFKTKFNLKLFLKNYRFIVLIVLLGTFLRIYRISDTPPAMNWDEVSHGYNAYSILKTGKDEWGRIFPTLFRAYGDYKLPVYIYLTSISEIFFGLSTFAVRLPSVVAGVCSIVFTYLLVKELFRERNEKSLSAKYELTAILSALLVAIEPWSLFLSRGAFEANLALTLIIIGTYLFLKGINQSSKCFTQAAFMFGLSVWTYNSARVFVPLFIVFLLYVYQKDLKNISRKSKLNIIKPLIVLSVFLIPMIRQLLSSPGQARYAWVSIIDEGSIAQINNLRNNSTLSPGLSRLAFNKVSYFLNRFVVNWVSHFSGNFLFFEGGSNYQFNILKHGLLYLIDIPFLLIGIIYLIKRRDKSSALILGWFFLGPIAASLTREAPHTLRAITMLPSPMIIIAIGFTATASYFKRKFSVKNNFIIIIFIFMLGAFLWRYLNQYFGDYRRNYPWSWQYGYSQVVDYIKQNYGKYDKIVITKKYGEPHEFLLFYWQWNPDTYQKDPDKIRFFQTNWYWVDRFDKFYFVNDWQINEENSGNFTFNLESKSLVYCTPRMYDCLLITSPGNVPDGWTKLDTVNYLDGNPAFEIYEN